MFVGRNNSGIKLANYGDSSNTTYEFYRQVFYFGDYGTVFTDTEIRTGNKVTTTTINFNDDNHFAAGETYTVITGAYA